MALPSSTYLDHENLCVAWHDEDGEPENAEDLVDDANRGAEDPRQLQERFRRVRDVQEVDAGRLEEGGDGRCVLLSVSCLRGGQLLAWGY